MILNGKMMRRVVAAIVVAACLFLVSVAATQGKITKEKLIFSGKERGYYLFVPEGLTAANSASTTSAPMIVTLHGSGRNGLVLVEKWKELAAKEGIILAGPDAVDSAGWRTPVDGPEFLKELVDAIKAKYPVDTRRVYLFGHSAGAEFALMMALLESEYFAAAAIHAGALRPEEYRVIEYAHRKTPMTVFIGTRDPYFPLPLVRGTVSALNAQGFATKLNEIAGHDHNYYVRSSEINRQAWEFLKQQKLNKDPHYTQYR